MQYEITDVSLNENVPGTESAPYTVKLLFTDTDYEFRPHAEVEVWVDRSAASIADVRQQAIDKAREFLTKALAAVGQ